MKRAGLYEIMNVDTGARLFSTGTRWRADPLEKVGVFDRERAQALLATPGERWAIDRAVIVEVAQCGCCGAVSTGPGWIADGKLIEVAWGVFRCRQHVGRSPCCIDGCGKTYAGAHDQIFMCGEHWRQAPRLMRDAVARVRRIAKRRGWDDALHARYDRLWNRTWRAIRDGRRLDEAEINALFGWSEDA